MNYNNAYLPIIFFLCAALLLNSQAVAELATASKSTQLIDLANKSLKNNQLNNDNSVIRLLYDVKIEVGNDTAKTTYTEVWFYPNSASVQDYGYETIYFNGHTDTITSLQAVTIQANGKALWFNNQDAELIDDDSYNVFTEGKELIVNYVGLEKNSITAIEYTVETNLSKLESFWSSVFHVRGTRAQNAIRIEVKGLQNKKLFFASDSQYLKCQQNEQTIICEGTQIPAIAKDDKMFFRDQSDQIAFSEVDDWQTVKNLVLAGFSAARSDNQDVVLFLKSLINNEMTTEQKISKVHEFVARDVRYVSVSEAGNAITPHPIARTLENRYGDCKDKTALLLEMLTLIGIKAHPVLVSTSRLNMDKLLLPSVGYFNHVVLCFELNEQDQCIDATDSTSDWRYTSNWINGNVSLPLASLPEQGQGPQALPLPKFPWRIENTIDIEILENGGQTEKQEVAFFSSYASNYRSKLETKSEQERSDWALALYESEISNKVVPTVSVSGIESLASPITLITNAVFEPYLTLDKDQAFLEYEPWILYEINAIDLKNKVYVTHLYGSKVTSVVTVTAPSLWDLQSFPADLLLETDYGRIRRTVKRLETGKFRVETDFEVPSINLPVSEIDAFNETMAVLRAQSEIQFSGKLAE